MKKTLFFLTTMFLVTAFVVILDFILSNTVLNIKKLFYLPKYYYELKKNCKGKENSRNHFQQSTFIPII